MSLSLYNDEVAGFSSFIEGKFDPKASVDVRSDEIPAFKPATWQDTAWRNHTVNNHALYSLLARAVYDSQNAIEGEVREFPLRLPSLLGGLISIAAIALLAAIVTEKPGAGLFAGIFLALQLWHIRYSTEARSYGLLFGVSALLILFLIQALRNPGKWRWWIGFELAQTACLWTYLGAVHLLVCVNLSVVVWLIVQARRSNSIGSSNGPCWIVATLFFRQRCLSQRWPRHWRRSGSRWHWLMPRWGGEFGGPMCSAIWHWECRGWMKLTTTLRIRQGVIPRVFLDRGRCGFCSSGEGDLDSVAHESGVPSAFAGRDSAFDCHFALGFQFGDGKHFAEMVCG